MPLVPARRREGGHGHVDEVTAAFRCLGPVMFGRLTELLGDQGKFDVDVRICGQQMTGLAEILPADQGWSGPYRGLRAIVPATAAAGPGPVAHR